MTASGRLPANPFTGQRARFSHIQNFNGSTAQIFPLLCPVREADYLSRWTCDIVYLQSGLMEAGGVFTTNFEPESGKDVWVVSRYEAPVHIQFVRVNTLRTIIYNIAVQDSGAGQVRLLWEQIITGLNEAGNEFVAGLRQQDFTNMLADMEQRLQYYLDQGEMMPD